MELRVNNTYCWFHNIYRNKMQDNTSTRAGDMEAYCFKVLLFYVKWYNIISFLRAEIEKATRAGYLE